MDKNKNRFVLALGAFLISAFSMLFFNIEIIDDITAGLGWPVRFLFYMSLTEPKDVFDVLKNIRVNSINFRIDLYIINTLIYFFVFFLFYKLIGIIMRLIKTSVGK